MGLTGEIADCVVNSSYSQLPAEAIEAVKTCVLDTIGVALAGCREPAGKIISERVKDSAGSRQASLIGYDFRVPAAPAALVNGVIAHALDFDDNIWAYIGHPSAVILPAILALGEKAGAPGKTLILAYAVGLEVGCKIGSQVTPALSEAGWHTTSTVGVFGAAAAAARLLGLGRKETICALSLAASESSGVKANFGTMTKSFHAGKAASDGVIAAELGRAGFTASDSGLEHHYGFLKVFGNRSAPQSIREGWGRPFSVLAPGVVFKKYPSCTGTHPIIDAILALAEEYDINPRDVESISCGTTPEVPREVFYEIPRTGLEGKFSMHFCASLALAERQVGLDHFSDAYLNKPVIRELMARCRTYVAPGLTKKTGIFSPAGMVEIKMKDGRSYGRRVDLARGNPGNPLSPEELTRKFKNCAQRRLSPKKAGSLLDKIVHLEELRDVSELMALTH